MPPGLAELEQLHMESNSERSRHLFIPQLHNSLVSIVRGMPSGLAELEQLHDIFSHSLYVRLGQANFW